MQALHRLLIGLALASLLAGSAAVADDEADSKEVARLIEQLGDDDVDVRRAADKRLLELGEKALPQLRKAAKDHPDADVRLRAIILERNIARTNFGEIRAFKGHEGNIRHIAVSRDGKR